MNQLEQLKQYTTVVADTGDFQTIQAFTPQDATTNPSLILKAVQKEDYRQLVEQVVRDNRQQDVAGLADRLLVAFGLEILKIIPGRVSTETDARLSFDTSGTVSKGRLLAQLYEKAGISRERVLIKIASTWEGIRAAKILEREGIHCNLTLMFSLPQAAACASARVKLVSPFVGRIHDWFKAHGEEKNGADDQGVQSVKRIYAYYRKYGFKTEVMGASFRTVDQIRELAGCDLLTISPDLLKQLAASDATLERRLDPAHPGEVDIKKLTLEEKDFRLQLNDDAMATEKLAEGIRQFCTDSDKLEKIIRELKGA